MIVALLALGPLLMATLAGLFWAARARTLGKQLSDSREHLKRTYTQFGEALRSTHDLQRILDVVLDIGMETVASRGGALLLAASPGHLIVKIARNVRFSDSEIEVGRGIVGYVAKNHTGVRMPGGPSEVARDPKEPAFRSCVAAPLFAKNKVMGVLALYDKEGKVAQFTEGDLDALLSRADQASVAIENVLLHQEAQRMAITDGLTAIWNYRYFQLQLEQELERASRFGRPFSLILFDIDDFKRFNDTYGHRVGDFVLVEVARRVNSVIRDADFFARYGGEEFALILPETDLAGGRATAEKIRRVLSESPFEGQMVPEPLDVTVSLGVACYPEAGNDRTAIFEAADRALLQAKAQGKNMVV